MANASRLDILETLYRFDEPLLFVAQVGLLQALFLKTDEREDGHEFLACYIDAAHVEGLREGRISIRGAYEAQKDLLLVNTDFEYLVGDFRQISHESPEAVALLPEPGVGILPRMAECPDVLQEKDILLAIYFKGHELERDRIAYSTLMTLLSRVQSFAKNYIAPPELRGLRSSTFDFTVGDPALGSLMIAIKDPRYNLGKLRQNEKRRDITSQELNLGVSRQRDELFSGMEDLARGGPNHAGAADDAYVSLKDLLPSEDTPYESVTLTSGRSGDMRRIYIDRERAEMFRQVYENPDWVRATRAGTIVELNSASNTILLRSPTTYRITTCGFDAVTFEWLSKQREFKIGARAKLTGSFYKRKRRDYLWVKTVDELGEP